MKKNYGWIRDLPDKRDLTYAMKAGKLPAQVDMSGEMTLPFNQGQLGSCTAQAMAAIYQFTFKEKTKRNFMPSRLKIYFDERALEGTVKIDAGATLRSGMKVLAKYGVCPEKFWTYSDNNKKFKKRPPKKCYVKSRRHKALKYYRVSQNLETLCAALADNDPIAFGFAIYESFETNSVYSTGITPMPKIRESLLGWHAVVLAGYDMSTRMFKVRNSWGSEWGDNGYFYLPFDYVTDYDLAADFWALKKVR